MPLIPKKFFYVYVLVSEIDPKRRYTGLTGDLQEPLQKALWKQRGYMFGEFRRYVENDLMKREPHPDAKPLGAFSIGRRAE